MSTIAGDSSGVVSQILVEMRRVFMSELSCIEFFKEKLTGSITQVKVAIQDLSRKDAEAANK